jgi:hypothetical protein
VHGLDLRIYTATRARFTDPFGPPQLMPGINPTGLAYQFAPSVTLDGLSFYLNQADNGSDVILVSTRAKRSLPFGPPSILATVNMPGLNSANPMVTPDGSAIYFYVVGPQVPIAGMYTSSKDDAGAFSTPTPVSAINKGGEANNLTVSANQLTVLFSSPRGEDAGHDDDIWISQRTSTANDWAPPSRVANVNSAATDNPTWISGDGCRLYLQSNRLGVFALFLATRPN